MSDLPGPLFWLAVALTLLQALDGWTTYQIHKAGGFEKNTLVAGISHRAQGGRTTTTLQVRRAA